MAQDGQLERNLQELADLRDRGIVTDEEYQQRRAALLAAGLSPTVAPPPAPKKRGGFLRTAAIGCGVLVLAAIVLVVLATVLVSDDDDEQADSGSSGGDVRVPLAVGSSGTIAPQGNSDRRSRVTILAVQDGAQSSNQFSQPAAGKKYYAVQVEVENVGTREITSLDWKLRDSKDTEVNRDFVSGIGQNLEPAYNLTPGGKTSGWVVFQIDADASAKWLRADPNPFLRNDFYFEAQ